MKLNRPRLLAFLLLAQFLLVCTIIVQWLYVGTHRLYLEDRTDNRRQGTAWQEFLVEHGSVVPKIITRNDARTTFDINLKRSSTLSFTVTPADSAAFEIYLLRNGERLQLLKGNGTSPITRSAYLPAGRESIEIDNRGEMTWSDLRIVANFPYLTWLAVLAILFVLIGSIKGRTPLPKMWIGANLALASILLTWFVAESALYLVSDKLPYSVVDSRRDLGAFRLDPRWQFSSRYGKTFRPNSNSPTQWEYGDLVRAAVIPAETSQPSMNRYRVVTDREGFRNPVTRERIAVAALGDSFTDSLMLPVEKAWPAQLERILGIPVQNYGVAGFGPQQELYVLQDYAIQHQPRVVVVAYFAGNDIFDAEAFEKFEQSPREAGEIPGWRIKKVVLRVQNFYTYSLARMALQGLWRRDVKSAGMPALPAWDAPQAVLAPAQADAAAYFDRGMFHVPIQGHDIRFAFMPSYLRTLNYSKSWLEASHGWSLTRQTYQEIKRIASQHAATVVVMFIPFKGQVYLPVLQRVFSTDEVNRDFRFYFRENVSDADVKTMAKNRLAQNELMRALCEETGMLFLDLTPVIEHQIEQGNNVYFPDDAHWNAAGQELAARELAGFLAEHHLDHPAQ